MFAKIIKKIGIGGVKVILMILMIATLPIIVTVPNAGLPMDIIDIGILGILYALT